MVNRYRLKLNCECGRRIAVTSDQPHKDEDGTYWTLRYHRRPDGEICERQTVRSEVRVMSCEELSPEFRECIVASVRDLVERMKAEGWSTVIGVDGVSRWQRPEGQCSYQVVDNGPPLCVVHDCAWRDCPPRGESRA